MKTLLPTRRTVLFGSGAALAVIVVAKAGQELLTVPQVPAFDEHRWIGMFRSAGYSVTVSHGVIFIDLGDEPRSIPRPDRSAALAWQRQTPDWKRRVIAAIEAEKILTT